MKEIVEKNINVEPIKLINKYLNLGNTLPPDTKSKLSFGIISSKRGFAFHFFVTYKKKNLTCSQYFRRSKHVSSPLMILPLLLGNRVITK